MNKLMLQYCFLTAVESDIRKHEVSAWATSVTEDKSGQIKINAIDGIFTNTHE